MEIRQRPWNEAEPVDRQKYRTVPAELFYEFSRTIHPDTSGPRLQERSIVPIDKKVKCIFSMECISVLEVSLP